MTVVYLPLVINKSVIPDVPVTSNIGAQVEGSVVGKEKWVVYGHPYHWPARWSECEPSQGQYVFEDWMYNNNWVLGNKQILGTKTCPLWARLHPENLCSQPKAEYYIDYAKWLCKLIEEFHPWGIELWNEPDCRADDAAQNYFGCWYDGVSWFNSGLKYGQFTKVVYDYVKPLHPEVHLLVGALMNVAENESLSFLSGAKAGGLKGTDLSFHGYITEKSGFDRIFTLAANLKKVVSYMPMICTETSVLSWEDSEELKLLQRDYLQHISDRLPTSDIDVVLWYTLAENSWLNSDLQRGDTPLPAWQLFGELK